MKEENEKNKSIIEAMTLERETLLTQLTKLAKLQKQGSFSSTQLISFLSHNFFINRLSNI
jgi:hypothetical protein